MALIPALIPVGPDIPTGFNANNHIILCISINDRGKEFRIVRSFYALPFEREIVIKTRESKISFNHMQ